MNIIDILRDCPEGTKLYSLVHGEVELTRVGVEDIYCKPSYLNHELSFNSDGRWVENKGECILFPSKENRNWNTFKRPFKDGDVLISEYGKPFIFKRLNDSGSCYSYCGIDLYGKFKLESDAWTFTNSLRFASEEEKERLFKTLKDNGYEWDPKAKTLKKLPKFKVGDRIKHKDSGVYCNLGEYVESLKGYRTNIGHLIRYDDIDNWELYPLPSKFDINTLKPFDKVLVRTNNFAPVWTIAFYDGYNPNIGGCFRPFGVSNGEYFQQCIPYEGNEHLRGTTNECSDYFKTWE